MRGPQGVWIQGGKLYVADTQDHRVLIYNSIPTSNGAAADLVLGQPNFTTFVEPDLTQAKSDAIRQQSAESGFGDVRRSIGFTLPIWGTIVCSSGTAFRHRTSSRRMWYRGSRT